ILGARRQADGGRGGASRAGEDVGEGRQRIVKGAFTRIDNRVERVPLQQISIPYIGREPRVVFENDVAIVRVGEEQAGRVAAGVVQVVGESSVSLDKGDGVCRARDKR